MKMASSYREEEDCNVYQEKILSDEEYFMERHAKSHIRSKERSPPTAEFEPTATPNYVGYKQHDIIDDVHSILSTMQFWKYEFHHGASRYQNDFQVEIDNILEVGDLRDCYRNLLSRFLEAQRYITDQEHGFNDCNKTLCDLKRCSRKEGYLCSKKKMNNLFDILSLMAHCKQDFHKGETLCQSRIKNDSRNIGKLSDPKDLRRCYRYLLNRFQEVQDYTMGIDKCHVKCSEIFENMLMKRYSIDAHSERRLVVASSSPSSPSSKQRATQHKRTPSPGIDLEKLGDIIPQKYTPSLPSSRENLAREQFHTSSSNEESFYIPSPPPPKSNVSYIPTPPKSNIPVRARAAMQLGAKQGLPAVSGHVVDKTRTSYERIPKYEQIISSGYGQSAKKTEDYEQTLKTREKKQRAISKETSKILPPWQIKSKITTKLINHHERSDELFASNCELIAKKKGRVKGLINPNIVSKDWLNLSDPKVRPRGVRKQISCEEVVVHDWVRVNTSSTNHCNTSLPKIRQPSASKRVPVLTATPSQIPRLPQIPSSTGQSIPRPPRKPRMKSAAPHRKFVLNTSMTKHSEFD